MSTKENINVLFEKFESFIKSQTIIGEKIQLGDTIIIPLSNITFALGGGGQDKQSDSLAIAAKATPASILVVKGTDVKLMPIKKGSAFDSLLENIPNLIDKLETLESKTDKKKSKEKKNFQINLK